LAQWDIVFDHMQRKGIYLHFKTQETENDQVMDGGSLGPQRRLYYRELIARFGYHLALNWNLGEETTNSVSQTRSFAEFFEDNDDYHHHIVLHTYPGQQDQRYDPLLGSQGKLTGASIQTDMRRVYRDTKRWVDKSAATDRAWVVANDEQGSANIGVDSDANDPTHTYARTNGLWGNLLAGGAGMESYFGYQTGETDLTLQNFRSRDIWWNQCRHALRFFTQFGVRFWAMVDATSLLSGASTNSWARRTDTNSQYIVYLRTASNVASINLNAATGTFQVFWFNPRTGGALARGSVSSVNGGATRSLGSAPNQASQDWAILLSRSINVRSADLEDSQNRKHTAAIVGGVVGAVALVAAVAAFVVVAVVRKHRQQSTIVQDGYQPLV